MWCCLDDFWVGASLFSNVSHYTHKAVERLAGLGFGWLDHHCLMHNEWEVDSGRVHAKVEQTLGDIQGRHIRFFLLTLCRCYEFVLTGLRIGNLVVRRQLVLEIVGFEYCALSYITQTLVSIRAKVDIGTY